MFEVKWNGRGAKGRQIKRGGGWSALLVEEEMQDCMSLEEEK